MCVLPIGDLFTMGPREAAYAIRLLGVKTCRSMHYATFSFLTGTVDALRQRPKISKATDSRTETRGDTVIRTNICAAHSCRMTSTNTFTSLLPERDEVVTEMEEYAAENDIPIIGPAGGTHAGAFRAGVGSEENL